MRSLFHYAIDIFLLFRLAPLPASILPLVSGAFLADPHLPLSMLLKLCALGIAAHIYGFVLNDVVDLEVDRNNPKRQHSPLVQGRISRHTALFLAISVIPVAHIILASIDRASEIEQILLGASIVLVAVYNIFGKRSFFSPILSDLCFGIAIGLLPLLGSHLATGTISLILLLVSIFFVLQLILLNSIHAGLKDIDSDLASGATTTPIWWGTLVTNTHITNYPLSFRIYGMILQVMSLILLFLVSLSGLRQVNITVGLLTLIGFLFLSLWILADTQKVLWTNNLQFLRDPQHKHIMLMAFLVGMSLLISVRNWLIVIVLLVGFSWESLIRRHLTDRLVAIRVADPAKF